MSTVLECSDEQQQLQQQLRRSAVVRLVIAAQAGDASAFGELFTRYRDHVTAVAQRRVKNDTEAQELCQEVFLQVLQKIGQLRQPECFVGWLTSITQRMAINRVVRRHPSVAVEPQTLEATCVDARTPLTVAVELERAEQVRRGLTRLRELDRKTLEAFYVQGMSLIEMSEEFAAPIGTIKRRLHEARKRLAKEVEDLNAA